MNNSFYVGKKKYDVEKNWKKNFFKKKKKFKTQNMIWMNALLMWHTNIEINRELVENLFAWVGGMCACVGNEYIKPEFSLCSSSLTANINKRTRMCVCVYRNIIFIHFNSVEP